MYLEDTPDHSSPVHCRRNVDTAWVRECESERLEKEAGFFLCFFTIICISCCIRLYALCFGDVNVHWIWIRVPVRVDCWEGEAWGRRRERDERVDSLPLSLGVHHQRDVAVNEWEGEELDAVQFRTGRRGSALLRTTPVEQGGEDRPLSCSPHILS